MRKLLAATALSATLLTFVPVSEALASAPTQAEADDDDDGDNTGLWGLAGLLGLAGLAGLKRRDDHRHVTTHTPPNHAP